MTDIQAFDLRVTWNTSRHRLAIHFLHERKAHPPLGARAEVSHGVKVVITGNHVNRTAPSGWMVRLVSL
jgi:hypothetical protein